MKESAEPLPVIDRDLEKYIRGLASSRVRPEIDIDELTQVGLLVAWAALESYDPSRGARFTTYAYPAITKAMQEAVRSAVCKQNGITRREYYTSDINSSRRSLPSRNQGNDQASANNRLSRDVVEPESINARRDLEEILLRADLEHIVKDPQHRAMVFDRVFGNARWTEIAMKYRMPQTTARTIVLRYLFKYAPESNLTVNRQERTA